MAQYKKDDIKEKINKAALKIFSEKGYRATKISDISSEAKVSVGNIYRYYKGKEEIFNSVIPSSFVEKLKDVIKNKIIVWKDEGNEKYKHSLLLNEDLVNLLINNRESVIILLNGSLGTKHEGIKDEVIDYLTALVRSNYGIEYRKNINGRSSLLFIKIIFTNLINMILTILCNTNNIEELSNLLCDINIYHMFGITGIVRGGDHEDNSN